MKKIYLVLFILYANAVKAQELFVYTEPASNMAAKSIGLRLNHYWMRETEVNQTNYHLLPEIMWGVSKNVMIHAEGFMSNQQKGFTLEGGALYAKYRVFSIDDVHSHFRVSAFGRYSFNNSEIHQQAIDFNGHNTGYEGGMVVTQLVKKVAVSASSSILYAKDNGTEKFTYEDKNRKAFNYTFSVGKLLLPKEYTSYGQTNMNCMLELLGQTSLGNGYTFLDVAPSVQFILNSRVRLDLGYRFPLIHSLQRTAARGVLLRMEYNIFNLY